MLSFLALALLLAMPPTRTAHADNTASRISAAAPAAQYIGRAMLVSTVVAATPQATADSSFLGSERLIGSTHMRRPNGMMLSEYFASSRMDYMNPASAPRRGFELYSTLARPAPAAHGLNNIAAAQRSPVLLC